MFNLINKIKNKIDQTDILHFNVNLFYIDFLGINTEIGEFDTSIEITKYTKLDELIKLLEKRLKIYIENDDRILNTFKRNKSTHWVWSISSVSGATTTNGLDIQTTLMEDINKR